MICLSDCNIYCHGIIYRIDRDKNKSVVQERKREHYTKRKKKSRTIWLTRVLMLGFHSERPKKNQTQFKMLVRLIKVKQNQSIDISKSIFWAKRIQFTKDRLVLRAFGASLGQRLHLRLCLTPPPRIVLLEPFAPRSYPGGRGLAASPAAVLAGCLRIRGERLASWSSFRPRGSVSILVVSVATAEKRRGRTKTEMLLRKRRHGLYVSQLVSAAAISVHSSACLRVLSTDAEAWLARARRPETILGAEHRKIRCQWAVELNAQQK